MGSEWMVGWSMSTASWIRGPNLVFCVLNQEKHIRSSSGRRTYPLGLRFVRKVSFT